MSDQRITVGVMARLSGAAMANCAEEDYREQLRDLGLYVSGDGTIIYNEIHDGPSYNFDFYVTNDLDVIEFEQFCDESDVEIVRGSAKFYFSHWYDGCESPHSQCTLAEAGM